MHFNSWRTYIFIYKDQIKTLFQDQSVMSISEFNLLACNKNSFVQFDCTTSTRPFVGELMVTPILLWFDFLGPYPTAYHSLGSRVWWNVCSMMNVCVYFHTSVFIIVAPRLWSLVTYLLQDNFSEVAHDPMGLAWNVSESGSVAADQLKVEHQHQNRGMGFTKAHTLTLPWISWRRQVYSTHDMKNRSTSSKRVTGWWVKEVRRLKQTCTPKGAARKNLTTITDVMILNYAVGFNVARGTQSNTQGVWSCKLLINSLSLQLLAKSPELMFDLSGQFRRNFPITVAA